MKEPKILQITNLKATISDPDTGRPIEIKFIFT